MHIGHALSALVGYEIARRQGGRFLVRIEDIDTLRCRDEFVRSILDDLAWLGITLVEPVIRQSSRFTHYVAAAERLRAMGLLYPCFALRSEIAAAVAHRRSAGGHWPNDPDGAPHYPGLFRTTGNTEFAERHARGEPFALRLDMAKALAMLPTLLGGEPLTFVETGDGTPGHLVPARPEQWGDVVVVRKEFPASYHLSVVVDDAHQGVTLVTRGRDLFEATGLQRLLQVLLGLPEPRYHHHHVLLGPDGRKLSKSSGATSLRTLRAAGATPADVRRLVGMDAQLPFGA